MTAAILTAALLVASTPQDDWTMCATTGPRVVRYDPVDVMRELGRVPPGAFMVAVDDCGDMGEWLLLQIDGHLYPVIVADCAQEQHVAYRQRMGYVADVGKYLWELLGLPDCPVSAQLLTFEDLFSPWRSQ